MRVALSGDAAIWQDIDWRSATPGAQLSVWSVVDGEAEEALSACVGDAAPGVAMGPDVLFNVWCAVKPVVADALIRSLAATGRGLDTLLDDLVVAGPWPPGAFGTATVADLLAHRVPLPQVGIIQAQVWGEDRARRADEAIAAHLASGVRDGWDYSEYAAWHLIERMGPVTEAVHEHLRGVGPGILIPAVADRPDEDFGCYHEVTSDGALRPLPHDLLASFRRGRPPGLGGYASARGLARWYAGRLRAGDLPGPRTPWASSVLSTDIAFAEGLMVGLADFLEMSELSDRACGHVGWNGASIGLADPVSGLSAALVVNTATVTTERFRPIRDALLVAGLTGVAERV